VAKYATAERSKPKVRGFGEYREDLFKSDVHADELARATPKCTGPELSERVYLAPNARAR